MENKPNFLYSQFLRVQSTSQYQKIQSLPGTQRWFALGLICIASQVIIFTSLYVLFDKVVVIALFASLVAGLATGIGALPALFITRISNQLFSNLLAAAAGVMLAATAFSLLVPGLEYGNALWPGNGLWPVSIGMLLGTVFLHLSDKRLPHLHIDSLPVDNSSSLQRIWLFIIAITIHNFPEGMTVGVSFGSGDTNNGLVLAIAIALQNIPEGLAVALPLVGLGYNKWKAVAIATLTGLVEPLGSLLGVTMVTLFSSFLPVAMGFAAGAMLFVISEEIIPETHAKVRSRQATFSLIIGFIIMMALDNLLT